MRFLMRYGVTALISFGLGVYLAFTYGLKVNESWVAQECERAGRAELTYAGKAIRCRMARKDEK